MSRGEGIRSFAFFFFLSFLSLGRGGGEVIDSSLTFISKEK